MSDEHLILHRPYAHENTAWQLVEYTKNFADATHRIHRPKFAFKKLDLFVAIPSEGVSNIPAFVNLLCLATDSKTLINFTTPLDTNQNWLEFYEGVDSQATDMLQGSRKFPKRTMIQIALECVQSALGRVLSTGTHAQDTVKLVAEWLEGAKNEVSIMRRWSAMSGVNRTYYDAACNDLLAAIFEDKWRAPMAIDNVCNALAGKTNNPTPYDIEFGNIVRKHLPLAKAMRIAAGEL